MAKRKRSEQSEEERAEARRPRGRARAAQEARQPKARGYVVQCPLCGVPEIVERPGGKCVEHGEVKAIIGHSGG